MFEETPNLPENQGIPETLENPANQTPEQIPENAAKDTSLDNINNNLPPIKPRAKRRIRLTDKQSLLVKAVMRNPNATAEELAKQSGLTRPSISRVLRSPNVISRIQSMMERHPKLREKRLLDKLAEGLDANKSEKSDFPDYTVRHKYLETSLRLNGSLNAPQEGITNNTQVNIFDPQTWSDFVAWKREKKEKEGGNNNAIQE